MGRLRLRLLACGLAAVATACTGVGADRSEREQTVPQGPAEVRLDVVDDHAKQFDEELPDRGAGTQQEFAAATYITAHLQDAGYRVALRSVPFKDLVRSTNVVALPPGGGDPGVVVTVAYDATSSSPDLGRDIGLFLELARAAKVADPDHDVEFVALAAELTGLGQGNLGSRALALELEELEPTPVVVALMEVTSGGFRAPGPAGDDLNEIALSLDIPPARPLTESILPVHLRGTAIFAEAGIQHAVAAGGPQEIADVMLEFLADPAR